MYGGDDCSNLTSDSGTQMDGKVVRLEGAVEYITRSWTPDDVTLQLKQPALADHVDSWLLMHSPYPVLAIVALYLLFVLKLGPALMNSRKPFRPQLLMLIYNASQVIFSTIWVIKVLQPRMVTHFAQSACHPGAHKTDPIASYRFDSMAWWYMVAKIVELVDTVLFVLRKKQSQVSFLHVYHHSNMAIATWAFLKYVRGSQTIMIGLLNSVVHVIMYGYYLIAGLGPRYQKYLWWKRYITWIQLGQFVLLISYFVLLLCNGCDVPRMFTIFCVANISSFLFLFVNFYRKAYRRPSVQQKKD